MRNKKRIYTSFDEIDRDLRLLRIKRDIHLTCLQNDVQRLRKELTFSSVMRESTKSVWDSFKGNWTRLALGYLAKRLFFK